MTEAYHNMTVEEIIAEVTRLCKKRGAKHLALFGSYARGTQTRFSDMDFVVYGVNDIEALREDVEDIPTLKTIDLFDYDEACNPYLKEDMDTYARKIF